MTENNSATWEEEFYDILSNFDCGSQTQATVTEWVKQNFYHKSEAVPRKKN